MPGPSPLPQRHGLAAAWLRTPDRGAGPPPYASMGEWLRERVGRHLDADVLLAERGFVYGDGRAVAAGDAYVANTFVWFHRPLREEPDVPGEIVVLHRDERLVVVDKPPFLSTIPRGRHVRQSVVVRLRDALGLPELSPMHRLDRITSGVLVLATEKRWRGAYQTLWERREVAKVYRAVAADAPGLSLPVTVRDHLLKERGALRAEAVPEAPVNAETLVERESRLPGGRAVYRLTPRTGRTHQLRMHLWGLGIPIEGDPLYPEVLDVDVDDFSTPLQLLASELRFTDPYDGSERVFRSRRRLPLEPPAGSPSQR